MVALDIIKSSNASLKTAPGLVALFVGATSGIGDITLRQFFTRTENPRVYFIGRNQTSADKIISELQAINPNGKIEFLKADVSLLKNVDAVTEEFKKKEDVCNLLFMTQGFLTMKGKDETTEGVDKKLSCNYYSRARFIENLVPQLSAAAAKSEFGARVVSVLAPGREGQINERDWDLNETYSIRTAELNGVTFNSAGLRYLQSLHPTISFIHAFPGFVHTPILDNSQLPGILKFGVRAVLPILNMLPFAVPLAESAERHFYIATNEKFKKGIWMLSERTDESAAAQKSVEKGWSDLQAGEKVWKHTREVFERATARK